MYIYLLYIQNHVTPHNTSCKVIRITGTICKRSLLDTVKKRKLSYWGMSSDMIPYIESYWRAWSRESAGEGGQYCNGVTKLSNGRVSASRVPSVLPKTRSSPLPKIDVRASVTVIQNDTRTGRMTFAHNILLEISHYKCERRRREPNFFKHFKIIVFTQCGFLWNLHSH